ncbi:helix-turn-helix domain-containing protein [Tenacibaculum maritimum]
MNTTDLFNLFLLVSAIHGFVFSFILFCSKNGKDRSMLFLNLLILSISLNNIQSWALAEHLFQHKFMLDYIQVPWHFLVAPFFYMFLIHYLDIAERSFNILTYIAPIFILTIASQITFVFYFNDKATNTELDFLYEKYTSFEEIFSLLVSIGIFSFSFYTLYKKEKLFPKILAFDDLQWIYSFFKIGFIMYLLWIAALVIKVNLNFSGFLFSYYPLRIATTILTYWLGYQGFVQLRILKEREQIRNSLPFLATNSNVVYDTIDVSDTISEEAEKQHDQFQKIDLFIKSKKKFLLPKYTLQNLSKDLNLSPSTLSSIINNNANKSFVDYINQMRVNQAKELLTSSKYEQYTVTSIGLESGFNSKSSFYAVFKKHMNCTPERYKNLHI